MLNFIKVKPFSKCLSFVPFSKIQTQKAFFCVCIDSNLFFYTRIKIIFTIALWQKIYYNLTYKGLITQLVECNSYKVEVVGSSPTGPKSWRLFTLRRIKSFISFSTLAVPVRATVKALQHIWLKIIDLKLKPNL